MALRHGVSAHVINPRDIGETAYAVVVAHLKEITVELLTEREKNLVRLLAEVAHEFAQVVRKGDSHYLIACDDTNEAILHIHALQNMVLSQAAARAYPKEYRLMGRKVGVL